MAYFSQVVSKILSFISGLGRYGMLGLVAAGVLLVTTSSTLGNIIQGAPDVTYAGSLGEEIFLGDPDLSHTVVIYKSESDLSDYEVTGNCDITSEYLDTYKSLYLFKVTYTGQSCSNGNILLEKNGNKIPASLTRLTLTGYAQKVANYLDYSTPDIREIYESFGDQMQENGAYKNFSGDDIVKYMGYAQGYRAYHEARMYHSMLGKILESRNQRYTMPVVGGSLSTKPSKLPNAARSYRAGYTDGVHHGIDIDGNIGDSLIALDDAVVIRIVRNFSDADYARIQYGEGLSSMQKLKNLDVLRGNQVWLKTMKGDVVFYSHLNDVSGDISVGQFIQRGTYLGTMGKTGVPGSDYADYHLHMAIMENPHISELAGTYSIYDYMSWDWYGRHESDAHILEHQYSMFE